MSETFIQKVGGQSVIQASDGRLTLAVPIRIKRNAGKKSIQLPSGENMPKPQWDTPATAIQLALARGHYWLDMLMSGQVSSLKEIAAMEKVDNSYVSRMVNMTTLAPDIVEAILANTLPDHISLFDLAVDPPGRWDEQRRKIFGDTASS